MEFWQPGCFRSKPYFKVGCFVETSSKKYNKLMSKKVIRIMRSVENMNVVVTKTDFFVSAYCLITI